MIMLITSLLYSFIDFYVPLKRMFEGDKMKLNEIIAYINYNHHLPYILVVSFAIGYYWYLDDHSKVRK